MKALIIEDEKIAQAQLLRLLREEFPQIEVLDTIGSVSQAVSWLASNSAPDIIFMDVELSDGDCFEIFRRVRISSAVIMTTAYDSYAIKAFEAGSIDYLLKPIDPIALNRAVNRCLERKRATAPDFSALLSSIEAASHPHYKERSTVRVGDRIVPLSASQIAFFYSEDKSNYLMTFTGERYVIDSTIDTLEEELNPKMFFRISRGCIVNISAIRTASRDNGKLLLTTSPKAPFALSVSRARVDDFLKWLEA